MQPNNQMNRHSRGEKSEQLKTLRQWLNIIFMIGATVGLCVYFLADNTTGTIIILGAMVFKMVECVLRLIK